MILPKHHVAELVIRHYHETARHSGKEHVLSLVREQVWVLGARTTIRRVLKDYFACKRRTVPCGEQRMADLRADIVTPGSPPFTNTGVDFFGTFFVKRGRSLVKRYGCIFTCFTTRAIHIEVAHSLDTDSFINALQRFVSRRGQPDLIQSDNGAVFVASEKVLREAVQDWNQNKIEHFLRQNGIQWKFNPPAASHMGGVWERQIRTVRKVLGALTKEQNNDDEGLSTLMCLVEAIVNGRPLTTVSDDARDPEPLTPTTCSCCAPDRHSLPVDSTRMI
jgi:transposase InsO family protein